MGCSWSAVTKALESTHGSEEWGAWFKSRQRCFFPVFADSKPTTSSDKCSSITGFNMLKYPVKKTSNNNEIIPAIYTKYPLLFSTSIKVLPNSNHTK